MLRLCPECGLIFMLFFWTFHSHLDNKMYTHKHRVNCQCKALAKCCSAHAHSLCDSTLLSKMKITCCATARALMCKPTHKAVEYFNFLSQIRAWSLILGNAASSVNWIFFAVSVKCYLNVLKLETSLKKSVRLP